MLLATLSLMQKPLRFAYKQAGINALSKFQKRVVGILILGLVVVPIFGTVETVEAEDLIDMAYFDEELLISEDGYMDKYQAEETSPEWVTYVVQEGDTINSIADDFDVELETLKAVNRSKFSNFKEGIEIYIPPYKTGVMHYATRGDSLISLAKMYGVTPEAISLANDGEESIKYDKYYFIPNGQLVRRTYTTYTSRDSGYVAKDVPDASFAGEGLMVPLKSYTWIRGMSRYHTGVDISAPRGSTVYAAGDGVVAKAPTYGYNGGYGLFVLIKLDSGYSVLTAHLDQVYVQPGERVRKGQAIGAEGSTCRSTGPHLHVEVHDASGRKLNPANYMQF